VSLETCRGSVWAFRRLMDAAQQDLDRGGEIKPVRVLFKYVKGKRLPALRWLRKVS